MPTAALLDEPTVTKIIVAEDQPTIRNLIAETLRDAGYDVVEVPDSELLWEELCLAARDDDNPREADLVISDVRMSPRGGLDFFEQLAALSLCAPVIVLTSVGDDACGTRALELGATLVFDRPLDARALLEATCSIVGPPEKANAA